MSVEKNFYQAGATMMELLGVLAIVGIIASGALVGYNDIMERYHAARGAKEIRTIFKGMHDFCSVNRPCTITTEKAYTLNILDDMTYNNGYGISPYTDAYFKMTYGLDSAGATVCKNCDYYAFQHTPLKPRYCEQLLTSDWSDDVYSRLYALKANDYTFIYNPNNYRAACLAENKCYELPVDLTVAFTVCTDLWDNRGEENPDDAATYKMVWYFI